MKQITQFVLLLLCIVGNSLHAQNFPNTYYADQFNFARDAENNWYVHRDAALTSPQQFVAPTYDQTPYTGWFDGLYFTNAIPYLEFKINGSKYRLNSGETIDLTLPTGDYTLDMRMKYERFGADYLWTERSVDFKVKSGSTYISPDYVWDITLAASEYSPPILDLYPSNWPLSHYNGPEERKAIATVTLGEGNDVLTRPLIMVDGVDFSSEVVLERVTNRIIRYGGTGWENVVRGLTTTIDPGNSLELFREYPTMLNSMRTEEDTNGEANYDIILVEFEDGADYIDRCSKLLAKVIERVNAEKVCGYENVIVGLSMGGQVSRIALTEMEKQGKDHQCRQYVSLGSPHVNANIPIGIQAVVYSAGFLAEQEGIKGSFYDLNRPAALQMIPINLISEIRKGNVILNHRSVGWKNDALLLKNKNIN